MHEENDERIDKRSEHCSGCLFLHTYQFPFEKKHVPISYVGFVVQVRRRIRAVTVEIEIRLSVVVNSALSPTLLWLPETFDRVGGRDWIPAAYARAKLALAPVVLVDLCRETFRQRTFSNTLAGPLYVTQYST